MAKSRKIPSGERAAKLTGIYSTRNQIIAGGFLLASIVLGWFLTKKMKGIEETNIQNIHDQKIDSGSINNYNAKGNITIENNTYNKLVEKLDSATAIDKSRKYKKIPIPIQEKDAQVNVTSNNQSGGQTANKIINNN